MRAWPALTVALVVASVARAEITFQRVNAVPGLDWKYSVYGHEGRVQHFWATGPDDVWAIGPFWMLHWDGQRWTVAPDLAGNVVALWGRRDDLWAYTCSPPSEGGDNIIGRTIEAHHFDGRRWARSERSGPGAPAMDGSDQCYWVETPPGSGAGGRGLPDQELQRLWRSHKPEGDVPAKIRSGYRLDGGEVWAVGSSPYALLHFDGQAWTVATNLTYANLVRVAASGAEVWALALDRQAWSSSGPPPIPYGAPEDMPALLQRTGGRWSRFYAPAGRMRDLWIAGPGDVWTAGDEGLVRRWVGGRWYESFVGRRRNLTSVWGTGPTEVWVHGCGDALWRWNGKRWSRVSVPIPAEHHSVCLRFWGASSGDVWAVSLWSVLHWNGRRWSKAPNSTQHEPGSGDPLLDVPLWSSDDLSDVWGSGAADIWAVGKQGGGPYHDGYPLLLHWDGRQWIRLAAPPGEGGLGAVWGTAADDVWAVGSHGLVLHFDGKAWSRVSVPSDVTLHSIGGTRDHLWIGGTGGTLLQGNESGPRRPQ